MPYVDGYDKAYHSMTWLGPKGYPENANAGRCYFTGPLGMLRFNGEPDILFADGISGDGFSFRWCPTWGAPAFNGGKGPFHEIWEYTPRVLGFKGHWEEDHYDGWDGAWAKLCALIDRNIPVQVGLHYSLVLPYGAKTSPRLAYMHSNMGSTGFGHHVVIAGYDHDKQTVRIFEPNDILPNSIYDCPIEVFHKAWEEPLQRSNGHYEAWPNHYPFDGEWTLHDGYGPYLMVWIEPGRDPDWDIAEAIHHSFRRNLKILAGEYPKPYALFGNQWQIPHWETGAPGMAVCADAILNGELDDPVGPDGVKRPLFVRGNIANHGVLGRLGAAGYLTRVATELKSRQFDAEAVTAAAGDMQASSDLFRELRYEEDKIKAGAILARIAEHELRALSAMETGWQIVRGITGVKPISAERSPIPASVRGVAAE